MAIWFVFDNMGHYVTDDPEQAFAEMVAKEVGGEVIMATMEQPKSPKKFVQYSDIAKTEKIWYNGYRK